MNHDEERAGDATPDYRLPPEKDKVLAHVVNEIVDSLPELYSIYKEHLQYNDALLPYIFLPDAVRELDEELVAGTLRMTSLDRLATIMESELRNNQPGVRDLIGLALLEEFENSRIGPLMEVRLGPISRAILQESRDWLPPKP